MVGTASYSAIFESPQLSEGQLDSSSSSRTISTVQMPDKSFAQPNSDTETGNRTAMNRTTTIAVASLALALAACSSGQTRRSPSTVPVTRPQRQEGG
jgi:hypothetical protein